MSLWFYGYANPVYLLLLCGSILVNYLFVRLLQRPAGQPARRGAFGGGHRTQRRGAAVLQIFQLFPR